MFDIKKINSLDKSEFLSIFGNVFEKSTWISEEAFKLKPFKDLDSFVSKIIEIYEKSDDETIRKILNLHPELAVEKKLTENSEIEQLKANLKECTPEEFDQFKILNLNYRKKFNFPFIIAVKGKNKTEILKKFRERINNSIENEFLEAKNQVKKIATFRLEELIK
tara:strand:- start:2729 stop:3223 length:495 start_codon:yes stop_codon:yes gene_type:complete